MSLINLVVCYNNEDEVIEYAKECSKQTFADKLILIITINSISDNGISNFKQMLNDIPHIEIYIYNPKQNLGYLNGMLYGYKEYMQNNMHKNAHDWIIMSNTDIQYPDMKMLERFANTNYKKDIWCVAPSVFNCASGSYGNPHYVNKIPERKIRRNIFVFSHFLLAFFYFHFSNFKAKLKKGKKSKSRYVYAVHGCYFFLKSVFVDFLMTQEFKPKMYSEEAYIAGKLELLQKKSFYDSGLEVNHTESTVTGRLKIKQKAEYFAESLRFILEENY